MRQLIVPVAKGWLQEDGILHELYQPVPLMCVEEGEEDMAVLAAIITIRRVRVAGAGAAQDVFSKRIGPQDIVDLCQHLLRRHLDHLATPADPSFPEGAECAKGRVQASQMHPLLVGRDARWSRIVALDVHEAPHGLSDDVVANICTVGSTETERRQGSPDQAWEVGGEPLQVYPTGSPGRHTLCAHHDVSLPGQSTKAFLVLWLMHIQDDAAFIQVGMHEREAQLLSTHRQQRHHLPARIAFGRLDLDNVSAKVAQNAAHVGSKWFGDIQHTNPVESPARLVTLGDFHVSSRRGQGMYPGDRSEPRLLPASRLT